MSEIVTKFSSDDKEMMAAFARQQRELDKQKERYEKLKDSAKDMHDTTTNGAEKATEKLQRWGQNLATMTIAYKALQMSIQLVNSELEAQVEIQDKAAAVQKTAADAQIAFLRNLGNVSSQERARAIKEVEAISRDTGVSRTSVYQMASGAMSAKGGLSVMEGMQAVRQAARTAPDSPQEAAAISSGLLDVTSLTGSKDQLRNLGLLVQMQQQGRGTTMESVTQSLVPSAIALKSYGASTEEATAATTSFTQVMKDPEGRHSSQAMVALAAQAAGVTPGGYGEDIAKLRSDPRLRDRFMAKASFDRKAESFVKDFLTPGTEAANLYEQYKNEVPTAERSRGLAEEFIGGIGDTDLQRSERYRQQAATAAESARMDDFYSGDRSRILGAAAEFSQSQGAPGLHRAIASKVYGFVQDPEIAGMSYLRSMQQQVPGKGDNAAANVIREAYQAQIDILMKIERNQQRNNNLNAHIE